MNLREGANVKIIQEGDDFYIHAPTINNTTLKSGAFTLSGEAIEIVAGEHIRITSAGKNKLTITANIDKEKLRIIELEKRVENLEKVIVSLIKKPEAEDVTDQIADA